METHYKMKSDEEFLEQMRSLGVKKLADTEIYVKVNDQEKVDLEGKVYVVDEKATSGDYQTEAGAEGTDYSVKVSFDPKTYGQLEKLAQDTGLSRAAVTRRATRVLSWVIDAMDDGYTLALLKEGENPRIVEFD